MTGKYWPAIRDESVQREDLITMSMLANVDFDTYRARIVDCLEWVEYRGRWRGYRARRFTQVEQVQHATQPLIY